MDRIKDKVTLKTLAAEAKKRLSDGYWQEYYKKLEQARSAPSDSAASRIINYYETAAKNDVMKQTVTDEVFYEKVKQFLDEHGEAAGAIGALTDKEYYDSLDYEKKQRYILDLSEKYRAAVARYKAEKEISNFKTLKKA